MQDQSLQPEIWELAERSVPGDIDFYAQYARTSGGPVLVLFCGTGRIVIPIARQGIPVMGLETGAVTVEYAKRRAQEAGVTKALFVRGDPTSFLSGSKHALVVIPGGGLNRLLTIEDQRSCLTAVRNALQLGGKLVLDLPILDADLFGGAETPTVRHFPGEGARWSVIQRTRRVDPTRQIVEELVGCEFSENGKVIRKEYMPITYRYNTPGEIRLLLESCGFATVTYGDFDQAPLLPGATRLIVEATRR